MLYEAAIDKDRLTEGLPALGSLDPSLRASFPVAIINNDWAPTLAFAHSLGRRNVPVYFYGSGAGRWSRYCRRRGVCPPVSRADLFLPWLRHRIRSGEIERLAPTTDQIAYYLAVLRDEFSPAVRRSITPLHEIERCLIKTRFAEACASIGQHVPCQLAPDDVETAVIAARALGYPLIVKPKSHLVVGSKERGRLIRNEADLRRYYRRYRVAQGQEQIAADHPELQWPLLQRYVETARGCVYSVSGIKDADRGILAATLTCKRQQWPPDIGISTVQALCDDERILNAGLATVNQLVTRGLFELELLTEGDNLLAIDLNPRAFGFIALDIAIGNDLPWLWWQTTTNTFETTNVRAPHSALECRFVVPYYFGRAINKLLHPGSALERQGPGGAAVPWVSMLGHRGDPLPMLLANLRLLGLLPHRGGLVRPYVGAALRARSAARKQTTCP